MKKSKRKKSYTAPFPAEGVDKKELKKISFHVNEFGEIVRDVKTEDINAFLNENVPDKKFAESD
jgi:hypothetical protein